MGSVWVVVRGWGEDGGGWGWLLASVLGLTRLGDCTRAMFASSTEARLALNPDTAETAQDTIHP